MKIFTRNFSPVILFTNYLTLAQSFHEKPQEFWPGFYKSNLFFIYPVAAIVMGKTVLLCGKKRQGKKLRELDGIFCVN